MGDVEGFVDSEQTSSSSSITTSTAEQAESVSSSHQKDYVVVDLESQDTTHTLQTILTLQWLSQHYESVEGVSLPRCLIYKHYSDYCQKHQFRPINAASFGKVIRQVFPELRTRRLGTRGQSKYHYYGIRVKESSPYFGVFLDSQRVSAPALYRNTSFPFLSSTAQWQSSLLQSRTDHLPSQMTSVLTLLPEFPTAAQTQPWDSLEFEQVDGMISQYRYHCQQVIEDILRGKLEQVPVAVQRFWQSLPETMSQVLQSGSSCDKLADMMALCDNILHQTMVNILIPGTVQQLPPSLLHAIRHFSCGFQKVTEESHHPGLTEYFHLKRGETVKRFCNLLKRKTSLSHLAQATRAVLKTKVTVTQMSHDWRKRTEQNTVCSQLMWTAPGNSANIKTVVKRCFSEFARLLEKHASVEEHIKWLDAARSRCLKTCGGGDCEKTDEVERDFLLQWSYVCNLLIRDQTLRSATSFGSFHLLHLLYEEHLLFMVDVKQNQKQERALWKRLFDTDKDVPSYFLTSADSCEFDSARRLSNAPFVKTEYLHRLPAQIAPGHSTRYPSNTAPGPDACEGGYLFQPYATPTGRVFAKPSLAPAAAGSPSQAATLGTLTDETAKSVPHPANSRTPSNTPRGYLSRNASPSPGTPTQTLLSSPRVIKQETDTSHLTFGRSSNVLTIPLGGTVAFLQTSPSKSGSGGAVTILSSGYRMPTSPAPVALPVPRLFTQEPQQLAAASPTQANAQTSTSREPPPLQPISQGHQGSPGQLNQTSLPQESQKQPQKSLATKIIKAVPVSSESKQKPVSFQFSITTNQKLNLSKGQILTTTNGERYLINEVQSTTQTENGQ